MTDRLRILFTEGASLSARQTLYPLGPYHEIDLLDPDPICQCRFSTYVRRFYRSPSFSKQPAEFLQFLAQRIRDGSYDVLLPTHEQVYLLSRFRDAFTPHVGLAMPEFQAMERMQNKANFSRLLDELELPQPETTIFSGVPPDLDRPWKFPLYLKLAHSTAGGGVFQVAGRDELGRQIESLSRSGRLTPESEVLIQQPARGNLSTVQAVFNHGELLGIHCFEARRLGVGGMSTARTSADHPVVRAQIEKLGRHIGWHGAFFIDYFYEQETGQPQYIEANPRVGETVNAMLSGINLPQLLVDVSRGMSPARLPLGRFGVRTHNLFMILISAAFFGKGRPDLIRELSQCMRHEGLYENGEDELTRPWEDSLSRLPRYWVTAQLLAWPGLAKSMVTKTVENYSLPESAIAHLKSLPLDFLEDAFS